MAGIVSSQGSVLKFQGTSIGYVTGFTVVAGVATMVETTSVMSRVNGAYTDSRVVRQYDCTAVEPGSISVRMYGMPASYTGNVGSKGPMTLTTSEGTISFLEVVLETWDASASVGELLVGTASFRVTGGPTFVGFV